MVYLWSMADSIKALLGGLFPGLLVPTIIATFALSMVYAVNYPCDAELVATIKRFFRYVRRVAYACIFVGTLHTLMPTSKTIALMAVVPVIVNSSVIQKDVPELYEAAKEAAIAKLKEAAGIENKTEAVK